MLKFRFNIILGELHPTQKRIALVDLEKILNISRTRLNRIRSASIGDPIHLKDWQLNAAALYFKCPMEEILNINSPKYSENENANTHQVPAGY